MTEKRTSFQDKVAKFAETLASPMTKFANRPAVRAVQNGLVAMTPIMIIGSIFITLYTLASPSIGDSGKAILPFLEPFAMNFIDFHVSAIVILALYASVSISMAYARILKVDEMTSALLGLAAFIIISGGLTSANLGATGLVTCMLTSLCTVRILKFFIDKNLVIRLPDSVPANVIKCFTSLIPGFVVLTLAWLIRSIFQFDISDFLGKVLQPLIKGADNIGIFTLMTTGHGLFWTVGMHFDNMVYNAVVGPLVTMWDTLNMEAKVAGEVLPHIFTSGLYRITIVPAIFYPPLILMILSKLKEIRTLGWACLPSAIFCITEPITFSFLVFNPYFLIPMFAMGFLGGILSYGATAIGLLPKFFATLPWATPTFLYGYLGTGSFMGVLIQIVIIAIGLAVYYPFFKQYEKSQLAKAAENENA